MAKAPETSRTISLVWWRYLVIDEGHVIKNDASLISQARDVDRTPPALSPRVNQPWAPGHCVGRRSGASTLPTRCC